MIESSLPVATSSSWAALDSGLIFRASGGWIFRKLPLLRMETGRIEFDYAT